MWNDEGLGIRLTNLESRGAFALTVPTRTIHVKSPGTAQETRYAWVGFPAGEVIQDCLVRDAVPSEPVSLPNSLLYGNLQGIFRNFGDFLRRTRGQGHEFPQLFCDIPYSKEQGIFSE